MASQDIEMQDAVPGHVVSNTSDDILPVLNKTLQHLTMRKKFVAPANQRFKVAIDFGGSKTTVAHGWPSEDNDFLHCSDPDGFLGDANGNDRIPTYAVLVPNTDTNQENYMEAMFGFEAAAYVAAAKDGEPPMKIDGMKLNVLKEESLDSRPEDGDDVVDSSTDSQIRASNMIHKHSGSKVYIEDPLTGTRELRDVSSASSPFFTREYLRYVFRALKASLVKLWSWTPDAVNELFRTSVDVAASLPALANEASILFFHGLLVDVGFPKEKTSILNEAKSAALYHIWRSVRTAENIQCFTEYLYVVDIGALTWDAYLIVAEYAAPRVDLEGLGEAIGGFQGSQSWNYMFSRCIEQNLEDEDCDLKDLFPQLEHVWQGRRALAEAVQFTKERFTMANVRDSYKLQPQLAMKNLNLDGSQFSVFGSNMAVEGALLALISLQTCRPMADGIVAHVKSLMARPGMVRTRAQVTVAMTGWGSLPRFVEEQLRAGFYGVPNVGFRVLEDGTNSAVARGNYLTLLNPSAVHSITHEF